MSPTCPRCGQLIQPEDSQDGLTFECSACSAVLRLRAPLPGFVKPDGNEEDAEQNVDSDLVEAIETDSVETSDAPAANDSFELAESTNDDTPQESAIPSQTDTTGDDVAGYEMLDPDVEEEEELELVDDYTDPMRELTTDGISVEDFPGIEDPKMTDSAADETQHDTQAEPSHDSGLPHVSVPEDTPDTIDFSAASEEVRDAIKQATGPSEQALHDEVTELLDTAEGGMLAGAAALGAAGMAIVGGADDEDDAQDDDENAAPAEGVESLMDDADEDLEAGEIEFEFEFEIPDEDILDDNPELPVESTNEPANEPTNEDAGEATLQASLDEFEFEADEDVAAAEEPELAEHLEAADEHSSVEDLGEEFGAGIELPPTGPPEGSSALTVEPFELSFDDVDESDGASATAPPVEDIEVPTFEAVEADELAVDSTEEAMEPLSIEVVEEPIEVMDELSVEPETLDEEIDFSASEVVPTEMPSLETPPPVDEEFTADLDFELPDVPETTEVPELNLDDADEAAGSLLDDVGAGLTAAAAGAAAMGAAAFSLGDDDAEDAAPENTEIVFDRADDEPVGEIDLDFEDAARPTFEPEKIDADDLALEPVDEAVANLPPAGVPLEAGGAKPFEMSKGGSSMAVAPAVPRKRNLLVDLLKLAIGAAVGLSIAQGILWWAMKIDPLGLAHRMPAALAIAVPEELRNSLPPLTPRNRPSVTSAVEEMPEPIDEDIPADPTSASDSTLASDANRNSEFGSDTDLADDMTSPASRGGDFGSDDSMDDLEEDDSMNDLADSPFDSTEDGSAEDDVVDSGPPVPFAGYGMVGVAESSPYDLGGALATAKQAATAFRNAEPSDRKARRAAMRKLYIAYASLADQATTVQRGGDGEEVLNEVRSLLDLAAEDASMKRVFGMGGKSWIEKDKGRGVVVAGEIKSNDAAGDLQEVQLQLDGTDTIVTIVTIVTRDSQLQVGDSAVVLGALVDDPANNLKNYSGLDDKVIWSTDVMSNRSR